VTNGTLTQVTGGLKAGTKVITDVQSNMGETEEEQQNSNPFMPKPKNRNNDKDKKK